MAISMHPVTGVPLNDITIRRKTINEEEAVTVHVMKLQGVSYTVIVHHFGVDARRIGEVLRGEVWPEAAEKALALSDDLFARH
ncbi:hypothetical protein [Sagittula sp.]|uniref:hypothetical protein n=1 Tax=Sagittula sp. TaxID=2038081 RepID=UPI003515FA4A